MRLDKQEALTDIDRVLQHPATGGDVDDYYQRRTMLVACVKRWALRGSEYSRAAERVVAMYGHPDSDPIRELSATLRALRADIDADQLLSFGQRVRADLFSDLLAQAEYLNGEGYRRAACVLAGAVLEDHVRRLAQQLGISLMNAKGDPQKASFLNDQLLVAGAYRKAEQAQVSAWQKMRNDAAHGVTTFETTYNESDLRRMTEGVRDFIAKHPA